MKWRAPFFSIDFDLLSGGCLHLARLFPDRSAEINLHAICPYQHLYLGGRGALSMHFRRHNANEWNEHKTEPKPSKCILYTLQHSTGNELRAKSGRVDGYQRLRIFNQVLLRYVTFG